MIIICNFDAPGINVVVDSLVHRCIYGRATNSVIVNIHRASSSDTIGGDLSIVARVRAYLRAERG